MDPLSVTSAVVNAPANVPADAARRAESARAAELQPQVEERRADLAQMVRAAVPLLSFSAALFLLLNHSYVGPLRAHLYHLRWWPPVLLAAVAPFLFYQERRLPRRIYSLDLVVLGFLILAWASSIYSISPLLTFGRTGSVALLYLAVFWGVWAGVDYMGARPIVNGFILATAIVFIGNVVTLPLQDVEGALFGNRFRGFLESANTVGLYASFMLPLVLWAAAESQWRKSRYRWLLALLLVSLLLSQSRTGLAGTLVGGGYFLYHACPRQRKRLAIVAAVFVVMNVAWSQLVFRTEAPNLHWPWPAVLHAASVQPADHPPRAVSSEAADREPPSFLDRVRAGWERLKRNPRNVNLADLGGRLWVWREGVKYVTERPLFGYGFGVEELIMKLHGFHEATYGNRFHNSFLGMALQLGQIGVVAFYGPLVVLFVRERRSSLAYRQAPLRYALRGLCLAALVMSCFESWIYAPGNAFAFPFWTSVMLLVRSGPNTAV